MACVMKPPYKLTNRNEADRKSLYYCIVYIRVGLKQILAGIDSYSDFRFINVEQANI